MVSSDGLIIISYFAGTSLFTGLFAFVFASIGVNPYWMGIGITAVALVCQIVTIFVLGCLLGDTKVTVIE